jgi:hypothetical protein
MTLDLAAIRNQFPALDRSAIFFDNPEGTQIAKQLLDRCGLLVFPKFKGNDWYVFAFTATEFRGELIDSPEGRLE